MAKRVLLVEDDTVLLSRYKRRLREVAPGLDVLTASAVQEALSLAAKHKPAAAVIDLHLNASAKERAAIDCSGTDFEGRALAERLRAAQPGLPVLGMTGSKAHASAECDRWFRDKGDPSGTVGVYDKERQWALLQHHTLRLTGHESPVTVFLVHGHDEPFLADARRYAEGLGWETELLRDQTRSGNTWIEMLEHSLRSASLVWVLASPDEVAKPNDPNFESERRPRPNVLLEYGLCVGLYGRQSKRVFLLRRPGVKMGTDINDIAAVEIPDSFASADAALRREFAPWLLPGLTAD